MLTLFARGRIGLFVLGLLIVSGTTASAFDPTFMCIQTDVRSRGMGEVAVALPDNPMGFLFNPANLTEANTVFGRFSHAKWWPKLEYVNYHTYAAAAGFSLGPWVNIGAALHRFNYGTLRVTDESGLPLGEINPYDIAAYFGYAVAPAQWLSVGVNVKYIRMDMGMDISADNVGFDVGLVFRNLLPYLTYSDENTDFDRHPGRLGQFVKAQSHLRSRGLSFGVALLDVGPDLKFENASRGDPQPRNLRIGFAWRIIDTDPFGMLIAADANRFLFGHIGTVYENVNYHFGAEVSLMRVVALRAGYVSMPYWSPNYFTLGASLGVDRAHFDVSYIPDSEDAGLLAKTFFWGLTVNW